MLLAALCAGLTIPHVAAIESVDTPESPPNILFIMTDEMRWDSMGIAGHPLAKTPNIDRLAGEGSYYSTAYTSAPICSPSRRAFFTGRYSHQHGVVDNTKQSLANDGEVDLPTLLELASLAIPSQIMGVSLVKLTAGQEDSWSNRAYSQRTRFMVRDGDYKLIADQSVLDGGLPKKEGNKSGKESALDKLHPPVELYNLSADPGEAKNLAGQSSQQRRLVEMLEMLRHWQATKPGPITIPGLATPAHLINTES